MTVQKPTPTVLYKNRHNIARKAGQSCRILDKGKQGRCRLLDCTVTGGLCRIYPSVGFYIVLLTSYLEASAPHINVGHDEVPLTGEEGVPADCPLARDGLGSRASISETYQHHYPHQHHHI